MGLFSTNKNKCKYGVVVDIGSGSVLASIIESNPELTYPNIIWSKREYAPIKQVESLNQSLKGIMATLVNIMMELDSEGRSALREVSPKAKMTSLQVTIAAPWSYTVTKTISYKNEQEFTLTDTFLSELLRMAQQKVVEELEENEKIHKLGLAIVSRTTVNIVANGYSLKCVNKQKTNSVKVMELSSVINETIDNTVREVTDKIFSGIHLSQYSFMVAFYYAVMDHYSNVSEFCLVDVTYEATEIGIVREGVLQYCTNIPFGISSLARELSVILSVTLDEAKSYLTNSDFDLVLEKYSDKQKKDVAAVFVAYNTKLQELFAETGDKLSIPKSIFLHSDAKFSAFFKEKISDSASATTNSSHVVYNVTIDILKKNYPSEVWEKYKKVNQDTAMLISAQFFHTNNYDQEFEQL